MLGPKRICKQDETRRVGFESDQEFTAFKIPSTMFTSGTFEMIDQSTRSGNDDVRTFVELKSLRRNIDSTHNHTG